MEVLSSLKDHRIKALNVLVELTIREYLTIADKILKTNDLQRRRVKSSSTVYSLLRDDLKAGCIIPPLVLALSREVDVSKSYTKEELKDLIENEIGNALILDGLQRTYNIKDAEEEIRKSKNPEGIDVYHNHKIRCEFYVGIDKIGVLYRMLTLNTGQTPMSLRHQIEILYSDYLSETIEGIKLVREVDEQPILKGGEYNFRDIIEGFTSYLLRDYLSFDKSDILENIKSLERLSKENQGNNIFRNYLVAYNSFILKTVSIAGDWNYSEDDSEFLLSGTPFANNINSIFIKSQTMTGFGAAIGFLKDKSLIDGFDQIIRDIQMLKINDTNNTLNKLLHKLDDIRRTATKIGNAQRAYFFWLFRELFNPLGDSYLSIDDAVENAYQRYKQNA